MTIYSNTTLDATFTYTGTETVTVSYDWKLDGVSSGSGSRFFVSDNDTGKVLQLDVTVTNACGTDIVSSTPEVIQPRTDIFLDTFAGPANTYLFNHTPDIGIGWWEIIGDNANTAYKPEYTLNTTYGSVQITGSNGLYLTRIDGNGYVQVMTQDRFGERTIYSIEVDINIVELASSSWDYYLYLTDGGAYGYYGIDLYRDAGTTYLYGFSGNGNSGVNNSSTTTSIGLGLHTIRLDITTSGWTVKIDNATVLTFGSSPTPPKLYDPYLEMEFGNYTSTQAPYVIKRVEVLNTTKASPITAFAGNIATLTSSTFLRDTFTDADNTNLVTGHTPEVGAWTYFNGNNAIPSPFIKGNALVAPYDGGSANIGLGVFNCSAVKVRFKFKLIAYPTTFSANLRLTNDGYPLRLDLYARTDGTFQLVTDSAAENQPGHFINLIINTNQVYEIVYTMTPREHTITLDGTLVKESIAKASWPFNISGHQLGLQMWHEEGTILSPACPFELLELEITKYTV